MSAKKFQNFLYLSKYSLSEVHSNTGRLLFEFDRLQYTLAAPEVFVAFANPVSLLSRYRVGIVRNTNIDQTGLRNKLLMTFCCKIQLIFCEHYRLLFEGELAEAIV